MFITTPEAFLSYPTLVEPKADDNGKLKYGVALIFTAEKDLSALWKAVYEIAESKYPGKGKKMIENDVIDVSLRKNAKKDEYEGHAPGGFFFNARTTVRPGLVYPYAGGDGKPAKVAEADIREVFYPGATVRAQVSVYHYKGKKEGITFGLENIQLLRKTERWAGRQDAGEAFDTMASEDLNDLNK